MIPYQQATATSSMYMPVTRRMLIFHAYAIGVYLRQIRIAGGAKSIRHSRALPIEHGNIVTEIAEQGHQPSPSRLPQPALGEAG